MSTSVIDQVMDKVVMDKPVVSEPNSSTQPKQATAKTWVYLFNQLDKLYAEVQPESWDAVRSLLGGKGANLAEMTRIDIPVPLGFTVTTEACNAYMEYDRQFPPTMWEQEVAAIHALETQTGKQFGDPANPLLVSCRSGAKFSMPGMMDTVLNIVSMNKRKESLKIRPFDLF